MIVTMTIMRKTTDRQIKERNNFTKRKNKAASLDKYKLIIQLIQIRQMTYYRITMGLNLILNATGKNTYSENWKRVLSLLPQPNQIEKV